MKHRVCTADNNDHIYLYALSVCIRCYDDDNNFKKQDDDDDDDNDYN